MEKVVNILIKEDLRKELVKIETREELHEVYEYLRTIQAKIVTKEALKFNIGDTVEFDGKYGSVVRGVITKINTKTIKLTSTTGVKWNVSVGLLKLVK